ncbi:MAG: epoxyqueuosine reductase QueH [Lachnospiraceae bacterium]|nr:epoxyqueuosine reductase QueH [Lachnospiraceae bacterium]
MQNRNYQKELEKLIEKQQRDGGKPSLLLHSCCAPCSSYVLEYLAPYFTICDFYYNPNISPKKEYEDRKEELVRLIEEMGLSTQVTFLEGTYQPEEFFAMAKGLEDLPEGGERCFKCYEMRLRESAKIAKEQGADYFATTLTISPLKNAQKLNEIGERLAEEYGVKYLPSDFKKKNGYKRSVELSAQYELYRQNYCGCVFSRLQAERNE